MLYSVEAFNSNQILPLVADREDVNLPQLITYYIQELDKLETIPVSSLKFKGYELIDEEHYFFFFEVKSGRLYDSLKASERVLRATMAVATIYGFRHLLVQHVEAIPGSVFSREHQPLSGNGGAMAG